MSTILLIAGIILILYGLIGFPYNSYKVMRDSPNFHGFMKKFWGFIGVLLVMALCTGGGIILIGYQFAIR